MSVMVSRANKGKEVAVGSKGFKKLRKGVASSLSSQKEPPIRRFGAKAVEEHGLKWFNAQKEAKYAPKNWIDEGHLALAFPTICDTVRDLGLGTCLLSQRNATSP
ncbi:hypothetical protein HAX54_015252 [Datura stramonium]|uniref:Chlorophyll a-b binding protein, chloroplastic n=1 Tax=Datura stramonium TaxID=4076 RepID=A0ABS8TPB7_DATST|nr:hypothetical protein [Datura stramonium]